MLKSEQASKIKVIADYVEAIMHILNVPVTVNTQGTSERVAKMYVNELFSSLNPDARIELDKQMTCFPNESNNSLILVKEIPFNSMCAHHLLPFEGIVNVGYVPDDSIIGLSKIPRVTKFFSRKPQLQELYVKEVGEYLAHVIKPIFLIVTAKAKHSCVSCRGAESDCQTITTYVYDSMTGDTDKRIRNFYEQGGYSFD